MVGQEVQVFRFAPGDASVRVVFIDGEPQWVSRDVANVLSIKNIRQVLRSLDSGDVCSTYITDALGRDQETAVVNESGLYDLIFRSRKPEAKAFKRWITHEVIPSIRKTGTYAMTDPSNEDSALLAQSRKFLVALTARVDELEEVNADLAETVEEQQPKADFYDRLTAANGYYTMQQAAQLLGIGRNRLFRRLRELRILQPMRFQNLPYQRYKEAGYFEVKATVRVSVTGADAPDHRVYVTAKGLAYLRKRLDEAKGLW